MDNDSITRMRYYQATPKTVLAVGYRK